ncbi:MAG: CotH kinase family protein, partial [Bacteroides sp.]|nr:CotH kinase family protein [Bacteroides sp.]
DDYIEKSYQQEPGSFDLVENESYAEAGNLEAYRHLESLLSADLSDAAAYNAVAELVDIENFTDFVITEMATQNISIDHNVMAWKPKESGKWRWILMDVDRGFYAPSRELISFYVNRNVLILRQLLKNPSYTSYFGRRLACQLYTSYNPRWIKGLIEGHEKDIEAEIPSHISRWEGATSTYGNALPSEAYWRRQIGKIKTFADMRPYVLLRDLQSYGFDESANLTLSTYPEDAGVLKLDGLIVPGSTVSAPFLQNLQVELLTEARPGYEFVGWSRPLKRQIVQRGSEWSYLDTGSDPGEDWIGMEYDDGSWSSGPAELGYGDNDENTVVGYGGDPDNKHITTYFRKAFSLLEADLLADHYFVELLKDDGAIVYLNGTEIVRENMIYEDTSLTTSLTTTRESINGEAESAFFFYPIDKSLLRTGENILAVEIHQFESSSTDLSFDLGLFSHVTGGQAIILTDESYPLSIEDDFSLTAVYQADGTCTIPEIVDSDKTLSIDCSPYMARGDVTISENATLTIDPGVEIWMPEGASIFVNGVMNAFGTSEKPIAIKLNPDEKQGSWGVISFRFTPQKSELKWVTIEDASTGPDPVSERGAISAFYADLELDHMCIEEVHGDPITARYSDITLTNSSLHSKVSGDLINVKYGGARIENCRFAGNDQPDTDAIDYDEVHQGIIRNSLIQNFRGLNSDAIDIGEQATEISIDSVVVFNITDKGVSVGQQSTVSIQNSVFINCNMGVAVKDSGWASVDRSLFYNNVDAIAVFEKNLGQAGGNVFVTNSILSNSSHAPYYSDSKSFLELNHSLSDDIFLPQQSSNLYGNPRFVEPSFHNFELLPGSPALGSGSLNNEPVDMGVRLATADLQPSVMISQFFIDGDDMGTPEFITLYNPSGSSLDVSGFSVTKGVTAVLPEGTVLGPHSYLYLTNNASADLWEGLFHKVFQWELGKLSNDGESIQLEDNHGIVLDYLVYDKNALWPADGFIGHGSFKLISPGLDNHFPESWEVKQAEQLVSSPAASDPEAFSLYPNPTRSKITIYAPDIKSRKVEIFNLSGHKLDETMLDLRGEAIIDLSEYQAGLLLIKVGNRVEKVVLLD